MAKLPFALQLYSVREPLDHDPAATLARVKAAGYSHVETAGTAGMSPEAFRGALETAGLTAVSAHVPFEACASDISAAIASCQALGVEWAVIPWLGREENPSAEDWIARALQMQGFSEAFLHAGILLCYHNHTHEFEPVGEKIPFDLIFENAPDLAVELDAGWAHYAGADPAALIRRYAGRTPLVHIKDVKARVEGESAITTELGNGATKFAPIFKAAGESGVKWLIVEQDESGRDPLESARMNAAYMRVHVF